MVDSLSGRDRRSRTTSAVTGAWAHTTCTTSRWRSPRSSKSVTSVSRLADIGSPVALLCRPGSMSSWIALYPIAYRRAGHQTSGCEGLDAVARQAARSVTAAQTQCERPDMFMNNPVAQLPCEGATLQLDRVAAQ